MAWASLYSAASSSAAGSVDEPTCSACLLARSRCFATFHPVDGPDVWSDASGLLGSSALCHQCGARFSETAPWVAPPNPSLPSPDPEVDSILDVYEYPLTWSAVWSAHRALTLADHSYDSEGDGWNWHPVAVEQNAVRRRACASWPGPICPACYAASCARCSHVFHAWDEARAVGEHGRLVCVSCAPPGASLFDCVCSEDSALSSVDLDGLVSSVNGNGGHGAA